MVPQKGADVHEIGHGSHPDRIAGQVGEVVLGQVFEFRARVRGSPEL
jgi:hypothetical protein